jgi:hypothetical protein
MESRFDMPKSSFAYRINTQSSGTYAEKGLHSGCNAARSDVAAVVEYSSVVKLSRLFL